MTTTSNPATGALASHYYCVETTQGTTPTSPAWKPLRYTGGNLKPTKDSTQSSELDASREISDLRLGSSSVSGEISFELSFGFYDDLLEAALGGTWAQATALSGLTITTAPSQSTFSRAAGSWVTDGVKVGDAVRITGLVESVNKAVYIVTRVSALVLYVNAPVGTLIAETSVGSCGLVFPYKLGVGTTRRSISVLTKYADTTGAVEYHIARGVEVGSVSLNTATNSLVTGKLSLIGTTYSANESLPSGSTFPSATKTTVYSNLDCKLLDATLASTSVTASDIGYGTSVDIKTDNSASAQFVIGNSGTAFIERGRANTTVSLQTYFFDSTQLIRFINETELKMVLSLVSDSGVNVIKIGRMVYTSGGPDIGGEGSIVQSLEAQALIGLAGESSIEIQYAALA